MKFSKEPTHAVVHLPIPKVCRYCKGRVDFVNIKDTKNSWPYLYICSKCGARVGVHPFTNVPVGTLANKELAQMRRMLHVEFDKLWQSGIMSKSCAYRQLAHKLQISFEECHIGQFELENCIEAIKTTKEMLCVKAKNNLENQNVKCVSAQG